MNFAAKAPAIWRRLVKPVAIIGAGIAGLTAAFDLERRGLQAAVFESGRAVGGMASSFKDAEGYTYDFGAHFVSNRLADALGASDISRTVGRYGEAVALGGRSYSYPFGLAASPRYAASAVAARLRPGAVANAADWFRNAYGAALAEDVAIPLAEAWSGAPATELSPAVGQKLSAGVMKTLYLKAASRLTGRAVCNGYSHEMPESPGIYHVYPEGGVSRLLEPTMKQVGHRIALESRVERIFVERDRVVAVKVNGREIGVSAAISTAPVHLLPRLVEGTDRLDALGAFRYRPMIFVNLRFEGRNLLPDTMLWVPDRSQPFFRVTEAPFSMPWLAPEGRTQLTFDIGCEVGDAHWTMSDEELARICLDGLCRIYPHLRARYIGPGGMLKTPFAYPVYLASYERRRQDFARDTGVAGLYSIGRNGEFAHLLMEDIYWRTLKRMQHVADYVAQEV
ncbi:FAD-dependent oxidoreductase [Bosea sp. (in: a-proteobacteria)]|uniref:protoporphyrinogen/coproporphyrinogen oxidase n=1 Tax=Bosea sp. (in: a-proteobacteria) TaxID=1871050 RepID=UPI00334235BD